MAMAVHPSDSRPVALGLSAERAASPLPFGVGDFPLLPLGDLLWSDAAASFLGLDELAPRLPDCLVTLTGPSRHGAALISGGAIVDAVWVDRSGGKLGADALGALSTATGTVCGYSIDDPRLVTSIPLLWRSPRSLRGVPADWLDADRLVRSIRAEGRSCALLTHAEIRGVALFANGELVATYTEKRQRPSATTATLRALLRAPGTRITVAGAPDPAELGHPVDDSVPEESAAAAVTEEPSNPAAIGTSPPQHQPGDAAAAVDAVAVEAVAVDEVTPASSDIDSVVTGSTETESPVSEASAEQATEVAEPATGLTEAERPQASEPATEEGSPEIRDSALVSHSADDPQPSDGAPPFAFDVTSVEKPGDPESATGDAGSATAAEGGPIADSSDATWAVRTPAGDAAADAPTAPDDPPARWTPVLTPMFGTVLPSNGTSGNGTAHTLAGGTHPATGEATSANGHHSDPAPAQEARPTFLTETDDLDAPVSDRILERFPADVLSLPELVPEPVAEPLPPPTAAANAPSDEWASEVESSTTVPAPWAVGQDIAGDSDDLPPVSLDESADLLADPGAPATPEPTVAAGDDPADDADAAPEKHPLFLGDTLTFAVTSPADAADPPRDGVTASRFADAEALPEPVEQATEEVTPSPIGDTDDGDDFVPARLDIDIDGLRQELIDIATVWLGAEDIAPAAQLITRARPGVDEFVATIAAIGALQIPGHETAVVRAMAREMHFRAAEVLCGV